MGKASATSLPGPSSGFGMEISGPGVPDVSPLGPSWWLPSRAGERSVQSKRNGRVRGSNPAPWALLRPTPLTRMASVAAAMWKLANLHRQRNGQQDRKGRWGLSIEHGHFATSSPHQQGELPDGG